MTTTTITPAPDSQGIPKNEQAVAALLGLLTAGPLGAACAWGWFRFLKGKWGPWALVGIFLAPVTIGLQIGAIAMLGSAAAPDQPAIEKQK